jgi:hypothetical protein
MAEQLRTMAMHHFMSGDPDLRKNSLATDMQAKKTRTAEPAVC